MRKSEKKEDENVPFVQEKKKKKQTCYFATLIKVTQQCH